MKQILLSCGTGLVASTTAAKQLEKSLNERGWAGKFNITQCKVTEVAAKSEAVDLCVTTTHVPGDVKCPVIMGVALITGIGIGPVLNQIIEVLER